MYTSEGNIIQLIRNCLLGVLSSEDRHKLDVWLEEERENQLLFEKIKKELSLGSEMAVFNKLNDEEAWLQFKELRKRKSKLRIIRRMLWYAAVIMPLTLGVLWFWDVNFHEERESASGMESVIQPGVSKATLVAANGEVYELRKEVHQEEIKMGNGLVVKREEGNLIYDSTMIVEERTMINTLKIPRGGEFKITLSDGTRVYLNSATDLRYPMVFDQKERKVYLSGEAYFEVSKDESRPFYVVADDVVIRVYGTEFNVNTHLERGVQAVLLSGKVGICDKRHGDEIIMKPGELACGNRKDGEITLRKVDVRQYVAWKDGYFAFENETLEQIMSTLSLWYNVDVFFQAESVKKMIFTGYMKRYSEIDEILRAITDVVGVQFSINDRTIVVSK